MNKETADAYYEYVIDQTVNNRERYRELSCRHHDMINKHARRYTNDHTDYRREYEIALENAFSDAHATEIWP